MKNKGKKGQSPKSKDVKGQDNGSNDELDQDGGEERGQDDNEENQEAGDNSTDENQVDEEKAKLIAETMKRKQKLQEKEAELAKLREQLKAYGDTDPETVQKMISDRKEREIKDLEKKGQWDQLKSRMAEEHQAELNELKAAHDAALTELSSRVETQMEQIVDLTVGREFAESSFLKDELTLPPHKARKVYQDHFAVVDGKVVGYLKPGDEGSALVNSQGESLSFNEALQKIVEVDPERDSLLRSKLKVGSGSDTDNKGRPQDRTPMKGVSRIEAGLAKVGGA